MNGYRPQTEWYWKAGLLRQEIGAARVICSDNDPSEVHGFGHSHSKALRTV